MTSCPSLIDRTARSVPWSPSTRLLGRQLWFALLSVRKTTCLPARDARAEGVELHHAAHEVRRALFAEGPGRGALRGWHEELRAAQQVGHGQGILPAAHAHERLFLQDQLLGKLRLVFFFFFTCFDTKLVAKGIKEC